MYNRGMGGLNGEGNQGFLENGMRFLDSFNYVVNSLCDVARNLESNADGLSRFWVSIFNLIFRMKNWSFGLYEWMINIFMKIFRWIKGFLTRKLSQWFLLNGQEKEEINLKIVKIALRVALIVFVLSFLPALMKRNKGGHFHGLFEKEAMNV